MISLYLLSHQDDELGILHELVTAQARGERPVCAFLTDGGWGGVLPRTRNAESLKVLTSLGVRQEDIHFIGGRIGIADGSLVAHLDAALAAVTDLCSVYGAVARVVTQAWEGGHQDHDATHLVGRALATRLCVLPASRQYHLYRAGPGAADMAFASPLPHDGPVDVTPIPVTQRLRYLALMYHYRSQAHVMLRIWPHIARVFLLGGVQKLQHLPPASVLARRPAERLLYEQWGLYAYEAFARHASSFVARHILAAEHSALAAETCAAPRPRVLC